MALLDKMMSLNGGTQFRAQGLDAVADNGPVLIAATHPTDLFEFCAQILSGGKANFGAMIGSLRYFQKFMSKLGGNYDVACGTIQPPGTPRKTLKTPAFRGFTPRRRGLQTAQAERLHSPLPRFPHPPPAAGGFPEDQQRAVPSTPADRAHFPARNGPETQV